MGAMPVGSRLPGQGQEASLTAAPVPEGDSGKDAARVVAGTPALMDESHGPLIKGNQGLLENP